ncbi:hypothetical protein FRC00_011483 [Tulasnella sp. 408]|nr:hypothetical protein FRC00_011483 [Tulasnella sp. 408]
MGRSLIPYLASVESFLGIRRLGLTIEALKQYMLSQGPSHATIMLEWSRIWVLKKIVDPIAPRYLEIEKEDLSKSLLKGGGRRDQSPAAPQTKPDDGEKKNVYGLAIHLDQEDDASFEDNEEPHRQEQDKTKSASGTVDRTAMTLYLAEDFKKTKKIT